MHLAATVHAAGRDLSATLDLPVLARPSGVAYGPAGYWPDHTAPADAPATVTVSSRSGLLSALADLAGSGPNTVIEVADGTDLSAGIPQVAQMTGRPENILIRPANPSGLVTDLGDIACDRITLAGFIGNFALRSGEGAAIARHTIRSTQQVVVGHGADGADGPTNYQIVELVATTRGTAAGDRIHIEGGTDGHWLGGWTIGKLRPDGSASHVDTCQILGHTGYLDFEAWMFGHAADSATIIAGWEQQGGAAMPQVTFRTCFAQRKDAPKGNDTLVKILAGGSWTFNSFVSDGTLNMNIPSSGASYAPPCPVTFDRSQVATLKFTDSARKGHNLTLPGVTIGAATAPTWTPPAWWSDLRQAA